MNGLCSRTARGNFLKIPYGAIKSASTLRITVYQCQVHRLTFLQRARSFTITRTECNPVVGVVCVGFHHQRRLYIFGLDFARNGMTPERIEAYAFMTTQPTPRRLKTPNRKVFADDNLFSTSAEACARLMPRCLVP
jgi:hypothetical protein